MSNYINQIILPRASSGIDWGRERKLLVRNSFGKALVWSPPGTCWNGRGNPHSYVPTELTIHFNSAEYLDRKILCEGGRLSKKLILSFKTEIDAEFGEGVAEMIDVKKTLILDKDYV